MKLKRLSLRFIVGIILIIIASLQIIHWIYKDINDNFPGFSILMLYVPLFLAVGFWLSSKKYATYKHSHKRSSNYNNSKKILEDLYKKKILTADEFQQKVTYLEGKNKDTYDKKHVDIFEKELQVKIAVLHKGIKKLRDSDLLSELEYQTKKLEIIRKCTQEIEEKRRASNTIV
jgi:hypothetical protein